MEPKNINNVIAKLTNTIDSLTKQRNNLLGKLNPIANVEEFAWVIDNNNTYYQYLNTHNGTVSLFRKGVKSFEHLNRFERDYTVADKAQVTQHLNFLKRSGYLFLDSENQLLKSQQPDAVPESSMEHEFYMLTVRGVKGATVRHENYSKAEKEAIRLATIENHEVFILGVVAKVKPVVSHEIIKSITTINL